MGFLRTHLFHFQVQNTVCYRCICETGIFGYYKTEKLHESKVNSFLNNSLMLISYYINGAFLTLQILLNNFDVDDIYRKYKGEDAKEEITILGAYELHNSKTVKRIGIDFNNCLGADI